MPKKGDFMKRSNRKAPRFKNEAEERAFWLKHSPLDYLDRSKAIVNPDFPKLKYSNKTISLRLPESLLNQIKARANIQDVPYQTYIKFILAEKVR